MKTFLLKWSSLVTVIVSLAYWGIDDSYSCVAWWIFLVEKDPVRTMGDQVDRDRITSIGCSNTTVDLLQGDHTLDSLKGVLVGGGRFPLNLSSNLISGPFQFTTYGMTGMGSQLTTTPANQFGCTPIRWKTARRLANTDHLQSRDQEGDLFVSGLLEWILIEDPRMLMDGLVQRIAVA